MILLTKIDRYLRHTGMSPSTFGRRVANDPRLVGDMRNGRVPGPTMIKRVDAFIGEIQ